MPTALLLSSAALSNRVGIGEHAARPHLVGATEVDVKVGRTTVRVLSTTGHGTAAPIGVTRCELTCRPGPAGVLKIDQARALAHRFPSGH